MPIIDLIDLLRHRAAQHSERRAYTFLPDQTHLTYQELDRQARAIGALLQAEGATAKPVLLLYQPGLAYIAAFFGCLYAGAVAVPVYPPRQSRHLIRLQAIAQDAGAHGALSTAAIQAAAGPHFAAPGHLRWLLTDALPAGLESQWRRPAPHGDVPAFLQYTSGSTGTPKGVMLTHANLLHNLRLITGAVQGDAPTGRVVSWLPPYHDMGLIGAILQPLYAGTEAILMSPTAFLQRPVRWLQAISEYRATISPAPNFAYDLCVRTVTEEQRATLDLRSWQVALSGAEPIRAETMAQFTQAFAPCDFRNEAFYPSYGLAEATLMLSGATRGAGPTVRRLARGALEQHRAVAPAGEEPVQDLVSCGRPLPEMHLVIVDPDTHQVCGPDEVGEVWASGPSVARGYWNRSEETEQTFRARLAGSERSFLRTGDLGFLDSAGELYITGRHKDLIIIRGRNLYPQDIEATVGRSHLAIRAGRGAVFAVDAAGEERLVVVTEVERHLREAPEAVLAAIRQAVAEEHEVQPYAVVLVRTATIALTSSGKIQRSACRQSFLTAQLDIVASSIIEGAVADRPTPALSRTALLELAPQARVAALTAYICALAARALQRAVEAIDPHAPLTALGLDSLAGAALAGQMETTLGLPVALSTLLRGASSAELAVELAGLVEAEEQPAEGAPPSPLAAPAEQDDGVLSQGQRSLWFLHQLAPRSGAYHVVGAAKVGAEVDELALRRAMQLLVDRHAALRTTFVAEQGQVRQRVAPAMVVALLHENAAGWSSQQIDARIAQEAWRPFDLEQGPLLRALLLTRSATEHYLVLAMHHLIADFWSLAALVRELSEAYAAAAQGRVAALPPPSAAYAGYVAWQEQMLAGPAGEQHWAYWQQQLAGELPIVLLPTDRPRPAVQTYGGAAHHIQLSPALTQALKALAREQGATLYMLLLAAFQALVYRYTGHEDLVVGSPMTGRSQVALTDLVGYLVNPLPLRARLSGEMAFTDFLAQVRQTVLEAIAHQDYPFALLVNRLQVNRDPRYSPLFQLFFAHQQPHLVGDASLVPFALGLPGGRLDLGGLPCESILLPQRFAQFDLTLTTAETDEQLVMQCQYNTDLFAAAAMERLLGHFERLLVGIALAPYQSVGRLPLLTDGEEQQLLLGGATASRYPDSSAIHQLFEAQAARTPARIALVCGEVSLTYEALDQRANQLAHYLRKRGVGPGALVAICVERSVEMVVGLLGILKAGGAYVPLDPTYPAERRSYMLQDSGAAVLLTQERLMSGLGMHGAQVICLDTDWDRIARERTEPPASPAWASDQLVYVIYTSGSTGRPKGAGVYQRSFVNLLYWYVGEFGFTEADRFLLVSSLSFDLTQKNIFAPLITGGALHLPTTLHYEPALIAGAIGRDRITVVNCAPSLFYPLVDEEAYRSQLFSLRYLFLGGEPISARRLAPWLSGPSGGALVVNTYGPTECTDVVSFFCIDQPAQYIDRAIPIGRPVANTRLWVLDRYLQPVPVGVQGELCIGGDCLGAGYIHRPAATAERFVPSPFGRGERLYRTGDLARYLPSGDIEFLGRLDHQIKIRGFRVEMGEIEALLEQHPAIREAVVVSRTDAQDAQRLVAYLVLRALDAAAPHPNDLRAYVGAHLPDYMLPAAFVPLAAMPLTPSGKVDRAALPAPDDASLVAAAAAYEAPRTPMEEALVAIWAAVLGVEQVGIHDNFFDMGGHSLLATQVVSRLRQALQVDIPLHDLFEAPTVAALAPRVEAARRGLAAQLDGPIRPAERSGPLPLSFAQQRLWFIDQLSAGLGLDDRSLQAGSAAYIMSAALRITGRLHHEALNRSLQEIVRRHEALRTTFASVDGEPVQVVSEESAFALTIAGVTGDAAERRALEIARAEARRPFDLTRDTPLRALLLQIGPEEQMLLLTMHHIASDGWSMGVLVQELAALYEAFAAGRPSPLPALPLQYADFAIWQRGWLRGEVLDRQLRYWTEMLAELPMLEMPTDWPRPAVQSDRGATLPLTLSPALTATLQRLSQQEGATLFMTLMAAFQVLMHRYTGQDDIAVGTPIANRNRIETEGLIGFFVNTLVLRADLVGDPSFRTLLAQVRERTLQAYAHQDLPFERLVEALHPERLLSHNPLFQVAFALQNAPREEFWLPGLAVRSVELDGQVTRFDLELHLWLREEQIHGYLIYCTDLFRPETAERLAAHYVQLLEAICRDIDARISQLPLLTAQERTQLLQRCQPTPAPDEPMCIHQMVAQWAERTPDARAVEDAQRTFTYAELAARATRFAHRLRTTGVSAGDRVAICMERTVDLIAVLIGVLQAGAIYVPLDPSYPRQRLAFVLDDTQARLLLTDAATEHLLPDTATERLRIAEPLFETDDPDPAAPPLPPGAPTDAAYIIYTSGSTGQPNGVLVEHQSVQNLALWHREAFAMAPGDRCSQLSGIAFDAMVMEIWSTLCFGGTLVLAPQEVRVNPPLLRDWLCKSAIAICWVPTPVAIELLAEEWPTEGSLRVLYTGGDRLTRYPPAGLPFRLVNTYGPTENTVLATWGDVEAEGAAHMGLGSPTLGIPLRNVTAYVLDRYDNLVPVSVWGNLCIGGAGLARYWRRPELEARRFMKNPFGSGRLFRTGDRIRYLPDGRLEFGGRYDDQVKIRGVRIEPGEVEAVLSRHPQVASAVVLVRPVRDEQQLVAYVVPTHEQTATAAAHRAHVGDWQRLFDETYDAPTADPTFHIVGWNSSYTGEPLPEAEMQEWVAETVRRIRALKPRRVLEIGCGTGLLLMRLLDDCEQYVGTDFSQTAIDHIRRTVMGQPGWAERLDQSLQLRLCRADELDWAEPGAFDLVIINSVLQYFPSGAYLEAVLRAAARTLAPGGHLFIGDVRHLGLLPAQRASIQHHRTGGAAPTPEMAERIRAEVQGEEELLVDPRLFGRLAGELEVPAHCRVWPKRGAHGNELTAFRYDVIMQVGVTQDAIAQRWHMWDGERWSLAALAQRLQGERPAHLCLSRIANARVTEAVGYLRTAQQAEGADAGLVDERGCIDPEALWRLGEDAGYAVELSWAAGYDDGSYDAVLTRLDIPPAPVCWPAGEAVRRSDALTNTPASHRPALTVTELRGYLQERLPEGMIPGAILLLDALPLTPNGKVDRRALPDPAHQRTAAAPGFVAPRTDLEAQLVAIWSDLLGIAPISIFDHFFELGGHSLLATRVIARVREATRIDLPLRSLFEAPTVAGLATKLEEARRGERALANPPEDSAPPIERAPRHEPPPLSFAQQRLWLIDQLSPGDTAYNMHAAVRMTGHLAVEALEQSLRMVLMRHEGLRTTFAVSAGRPVQVINPDPHFCMNVIDLATEPPSDEDAALQGYMRQEAERPFDLCRDLMLRATLLRLGAQEHLLLLTMHHIASDGWSVGILIREVAAYYEALTAGREPLLPELPVQYADFAIWQRQWLQEAALQRQLDYWRAQVAGLPVLDLPTDWVRPAVRTSRGATLRFQVPLAEANELRAFSQREGATLFMTLLAAFQVLLYRYTGQEDIGVGSPIANRRRPEVEGLIGFFVNTLVMRGDLSGNPTFRELLARVRERALDAYLHQDLPFEELVSALQIQRSMSHTPLFQTMFALQNVPTHALKLPGLLLRRVEMAETTTTCDLTLSLTEEADGLAGALNYSTDLFTAPRMCAFIAHFQTLLAAVVADPEQRIAYLPLLPAAEREQMLTAWNQTTFAYPRDQSIPSLFAAQAAHSPEAVAIRYQDEALSYRTLDARANQLAHALQRMGVRPGEMIALYLERSAAFIISMLAILKAGGAYVPLDTTYPPERLAFMIRDTGAPVVITESRLAPGLPPHDAQLFCIDTARELLAEESTKRPAVPIAPESPAYVIYTSGSTGQPKGVVVTHRAVVRLVMHTDYCQVTATDAVAQASNTSFDAATFEIWGALLNGAQVVGVAKELLLSPAELATAIAARRFTILFLTTALFNQVAAAAPGAFAPLRCLLFGGEAVDPEAVRRVLEAGAPSRFLHVYGPTETTTFATYEVIEAVADGAVTVPIGRPIRNTACYVLDAAMQPVPWGVPGELYIGGDGVAQGYLNRPALTAERFVVNPFGAGPLYKTGDLVRYRSDGRIEFVGRIDQQVKIRGFRIELGEVEAVLAQHPAVQQAAVVDQRDTNGQKRLVAYLVIAAGQADAAPLPAIRRHMLDRLPAYMIPSAYVIVDAIALTPNGKVDRRALPAPEGERSDLSAAHVVAPRTPIERRLVAIWESVLGVQPISIYDNFFELGGHSLLATQVISRIQHEMQIQLPLRSLFEAPTVAGLSERIAQTSPGLPIEPIVRAKREGALPLSFAQQRLWFFEQLQPGSASYNVPAAVRITGRLQIAALQRSLAAVVSRHEPLRTTFAAIDGRPVQVIQEVEGFNLEIIDLTADEAEVALQAQMRAEAQRPFDLGRDLMLRAKLLQCDDATHVLLLTMHHIASDGWSIGVLIREVAALYQAFVAGQPAALPELPIQYADFALWQRQWLQGERLDQQVAYWQSQLAGLPTLELPTDRLRPAVQRTAGATLPLVIDPALTSALIALGQQEGATLFMTLLAAFQTLLYRYTGQRDFGVGTPIANRNRMEIEGLIGFFVNTLVMRADLSARPTFRNLLARVRERAMGAYLHQDLPFEQLVDLLHTERNLSHHPLFQVMFALQNAPMQALELPGMRLEPIETPSDAARFDLTLTLTPAGDGLVGTLIYNTDLFEAATIEQMISHLQRLLRAVVDDPDQVVDRLPLLSELERAGLMNDWNQTQRERAATMLVQQAVEVQAAQRPDAPAVVCGDQQITYGELNRRANQLARYLRRQGVGSEQVVAICMERSCALIVAMLAVCKAGGAYLPIDPAYPADRISWMITQSAAPVLLTQQRWRAKAGDHTAQVFCLDTEWSAVADESEANLPPTAHEQGLAYVIYTSGSTGRPKGVEVEHRTLLNLIAWHLRTYGLGPADRTTQIAGVGFDAAVWEIWPTLYAGAALYVADDEVRLAPTALRDWLVAQQITLCFVPTPLAEALLRVAWPAPCALRALLTGGDTLNAYPPAELPFALVNHYGPTENTVVATAAVVDERGAAQRAPSIGRPIDGVRAYILDQHLEPVPRGVAGTLYIGGDGLARGYRDRPDLTAERFVPAPGGERLYNTGDLARYLPDGQIEFLGRADRQIKIRGYRIEPGEIEATLLQHPAIAQAVVVARTDPPGERRLVAYIVVHGERTPAFTEECSAFLAARLPAYMIPSALLLLERLPLTLNGKIDHQALPAPEADSAERHAAYEAPRGPVEELLAAIWAEVLGIGQVGIHDNFFSLGGHSLLATQAISRVQQALQLDLPVRALFEAPTVAALAGRIVAHLHAVHGLAAPPIAPAPRQGPLPLSFAQQRLWFIDQLQSNSTAYHIPMLIKLTGQLDVTALERSLEAVVRRHESLRTTFAVIDGEPVQMICADPTFTMSLIEAPEAEALRRAHEAARAPFDLASDLLLRAMLLRQGEEEHLLLLTMHHIAADGWSMGVLVREMTQLYTAFGAGYTPELPDLPIQYGDFAIWQRTMLQGALLERQVAYWKAELQGALPLELPTDRPRPAVQTYNGATLELALSADLTAALKALSQQEGATLFMTLLAAFQTLLHRYTGQDDILVGTPIANRNRVEIEGLIGFFVNTLVLRADLSGNPTFRALLTQVRERALGAYLHQDLPFEHLVDLLQPERNLSHAPLFQVMFVLQNAPLEAVELPALTLTPLEIAHETAKFDLTLTMHEGPAGLVGRCEYNTDLFFHETIAALCTRFQTLLAHIADAPDQPISALSLMTEAERAQIVTHWNETAAPYRKACAVHLLFAEQVARTPNAPAVSYGEERLTYAELERRTSQVARLLQRHGVGPNVRVGLYVERSLEMVIGLLAILRAGGAYVPLDPAYPAERLAYMIGDAGVQVVLTQERLRTALPAHIETILALDDAAASAEAPEPPPAPHSAATDLAYIIYTSGSTGRPKGALITHQSLLNLLTAVQQAPGMTSADVVLAVTSISFDVAAQEILLPLITGAHLVIASRAALIDSRRLAALLDETGVTRLTATPATWRALLESGWQGAERLTLITTGEALPLDLVAPLLRCGAALWNMYGPTETTIWSTGYRITHAEQPVHIGWPIANTQTYVLDRHLQPVPVGVTGELYIGGDGLAWGYLNQAGLTAERFIPHPFGAAPGARLYRTGDRARYRFDGSIECLGRVDHQVKIRGLRIELGEIEAVLLQHPAVQQAVVQVRTGQSGDARIVAYLVAQAAPEQGELSHELRRYLAVHLPGYMVPSAFVMLPALPLLPSGKIDRRRLPAPTRHESAGDQAGAAPGAGLQGALAALWGRLLEVERVGLYENFFDLGAHSLMMVKVREAIQHELGIEVALTDLFAYPTVASLAAALSERLSPAVAAAASQPMGAAHPAERRSRLGSATDVAIIGIACRFPQSPDLQTYWQNLCAGRELITEVPVEELEPSPASAHPVLRTQMVRAGGYIEGRDRFDAEFFGFSEKEAQWTDPQHRLFLECVWEAIEDGGYQVEQIGERTSLYAGAAQNDYLSQQHLNEESLADYQHARLTGSPQALPTRVAYLLNLQRESVHVDTACSTGLAAVHLACESLLAGRSDYALAGGVTIAAPHKTGYLYTPGFIMSPDGHCRPFDEKAAGTVPGNGVGVVLLKRYGDALRDGDPIYAIIKGSAMNNDGSHKVGYTAPSVRGQRQVVAEALQAAGVSADTIRYVEAHGSGTPLGDPIEVAALTAAFRQSSSRNGYCAIGSVKANIGHADRAAGMAGLIKAVQVLTHRQAPPAIHYTAPNPEIDFARSPFFVNPELHPLDGGAEPLRASVNSLGIGGTNVHLILQEASPASDGQADLDASDLPTHSHSYLLPLSARTVGALREGAARLAAHLRAHPQQPLADLAYTLQVGRCAYAHRLVLVGSTHEELAALAAEAAEVEWSEPYKSTALTYAPAQMAEPPRIAFLFTGHGTQYSGMGRRLYASAPVFRQALDRCDQILRPHLPASLLTYLFDEAQAEALNRAPIGQPAVLALEYALTQLWASWGVKPDLVMGHSLGEYTAACVAGAISIEEVLPLIVRRGQLMERATEAGAMASVMMGADALQPYLQRAQGAVSIAAINGARQTLIAGSAVAMRDLLAQWRRDGLMYSQLPVSQAPHTPLMEPLRERLMALIDGVPSAPLQIPLVSNRSGKLIATERLDAAHWWQHLRQPVQFAAGLATLAQEGANVLLEIGPTPALASLAELEGYPDALISGSLHSGEEDEAALLSTFGYLWANGVAVDWRVLHGSARRRVHAPTYAFDRRSYWLAADSADQPHALPVATSTRLSDQQASLEERIARRFGEQLGQGPVGMHDNLFALGGGSLQAIQIAVRLRLDGYAITPQAIFEHPTPAELAAHLRSGSTAPLPGMIESQQEVAASSHEPAQPRGVSAHEMAEPAGPAATVMLTGATGYLGSHILHRLLTSTAARVYCLVRAANPAEGLDRIMAQMEWHFPSGDVRRWAPRIQAVPGDLTQPDLGLAPALYDQMSQNIEIIYHAAAEVRHIGHLEHFMRVNVEGTRQIIHLATRRRPKAVHYVSTLGVAGDLSANPERSTFAEQELDIDQDFTGHPYAQSKYLAEKLMREAAAQGCSTTVYRTGYIMADGRSGRFQKNIGENEWYRLLRAFVYTGVAPSRAALALDLTPVDHIAKAIVLLSQAPGVSGQTFHLMTGQPMAFSQLMQYLHAMGYAIALLEPDDYAASVLTLSTEESYQAEMGPLLALMRQQGGEPQALPITVAHAHTAAWLRSVGIEEPVPDERYVRAMLAHCIEVGYLPAPRHWARIKFAKGGVSVADQPKE